MAEAELEAAFAVGFNPPLNPPTNWLVASGPKLSAKFNPC